MGKHLSKQDVNVNSSNWQSQLYSAIENGRVETVSLLIEKGVNVNQIRWSQSPIHYAVSERPIRQKLISADTDNRPILPIISADISADNQPKNVPYFWPKNWTKFCKLFILILQQFSSWFHADFML